jgi:hypothetical protein
VQMANRQRSDENAQSLTMLMRAAVEARNRLARARERLRVIEAKLRGAARTDYERQRSQALAEYIDAAGRARRARTQLLKTLKERSV